jgi:hypothetical protein
MVNGFWRGPIASCRQADEIIRWTGWVFASLAIVPMVTSRTEEPVLVAFSVVTCLFSVLLLTRRSFVASLLLFVASTAVTLLAAVSLAWIIAYEVQTGVYANSVAYLAAPALWGLLTALSWRAVRATRALARLDRVDPQHANEAQPRAPALSPPWLR